MGKGLGTVQQSQHDGEFIVAAPRCVLAGTPSLRGVVVQKTLPNVGVVSGEVFQKLGRNSMFSFGSVCFGMQMCKSRNASQHCETGEGVLETAAVAIASEASVPKCCINQTFALQLCMSIGVRRMLKPIQTFKQVVLWVLV